MKTAVDWLEDNLIGNPFSEKDFTHNVNMFKKAKEMEKEQILDAAKSCNYIGGATNIEAEQYYNETFKK